jgi:hypothetical protein
MTGTEIGIVLSGITTLLGAVTTMISTVAATRAKRAEASSTRAEATAARGVEVSQGNAEKLVQVEARVAEVHSATNGLTARLEASAEKIGVLKGKAEEKANPTP